MIKRVNEWDIVLEYYLFYKKFIKLPIVYVWIVNVYAIIKENIEIKL